jgi:hypothetical protein
MLRMVKREHKVKAVKEDVLEICKDELGLNCDETQRALVQYDLAYIDHKMTNYYAFPEVIPRGPLKGS